jgi:hypothetical protein
MRFDAIVRRLKRLDPMPESGTNLTMEDLTKLRRAVVAIEAAQRVVASYCGKRDGIAASCRATAWLLDELYQSETTTTERHEIDRELKTQNRATKP